MSWAGDSAASLRDPGTPKAAPKPLRATLKSSPRPECVRRNCRCGFDAAAVARLRGIGRGPGAVSGHEHGGDRHETRSRVSAQPPLGGRRLCRAAREGHPCAKTGSVKHYQYVEGTSFAAPIVAATAACVLEANRSLKPRQIAELLIVTAERVPGASDERQGAGAINAGEAVRAAISSRLRQVLLCRAPTSGGEVRRTLSRALRCLARSQ